MTVSPDNLQNSMGPTFLLSDIEAPRDVAPTTLPDIL
jgi:hypothetical protein